MLYSLNKRNTLKQSQFIYIAPFTLALRDKIKTKNKWGNKGRNNTSSSNSNNNKKNKNKNILIFPGTAICLV